VNPHLPSPDVLVQTGGCSLRFHRANCLDVLASLPAGSVDVIVTSPPYNFGIRYRTHDDSLPRERYLQWTSEWISAAARVLSPGGSLFLNVGTKPKDPWLALDVVQAARAHLHLQNTIHWIKSIAIDQQAAGRAAALEADLALGHYKPINSPRFLNDCQEFIFHLTPGGATVLDRLAIGVPYQDKSNVGRWRAAAGGRRCRGNTWFIPYDTIQSRDRERPHPATFPVRLADYCLRLHGVNRIQLALDPFLGLGSTAIACARLGLPFMGIEIDEVYLQEAVARTRAALDGGRPRRSAPRRHAPATARLPLDDD
jgi:site-specific DNA-methyltransferase (adenine-specific)